MASRQYIGARYVPILLGEWNNKIAYESLSIVTYMGNSFTSKKAVPVGIDISNNEYWVNTGNYNAQVEAYRQEVEQLNDTFSTDIDTINSALDKIGIVKEYANLNTTLNDMTEASNFNSYTVEEDGIYYISANLFGAKNTESRTLIGVQKNNIAITCEHNGTGYYGVETSHIYDCKKGDTISGRFFNSVGITTETNNLISQIIRLK